MARVPSKNQIASLFGGGGGARLPPIVAILLAATVLASILGVVGARHGFPLLAKSALIADEVLRLELWRLFTWVFFVADPWGLLFAFMILTWVGREFAQRWGPARFLVAFLGLGVAIGGVVVLLSVVYPPIAGLPYFGSGPVQGALIIMWASLYRTRQVHFFFVALTGTQLIWASIGMTALWSVFSGVEHFVPHFIADLIALAWVYGPSPREAWIEHKLRGMEQKRRASHLRSVPRDKDDEQPPGGRWLN